VTHFWSLTRYNSKTFLPFDPKVIGGNNIQSYNQFNTKADENGNVHFTFSMTPPSDDSYWIPVTAGGYYNIFRYYSPTKELHGQSAKDLIYRGSKLEKLMKSPQF